MEHINKAIYSLPDIRHAIKPLWSAWALVAIGAVCALFLFFKDNISPNSTTALASIILIGAAALITLICFYSFGDCHRPYHRQLHRRLEPTYSYYAASVRQQLIDALQQHDEKALNAVKKSANPELILVRYSDPDDSIFFSQLLQVDGGKEIPLTDIIINIIK